MPRRGAWRESWSYSRHRFEALGWAMVLYPGLGTGWLLFREAGGGATAADAAGVVGTIALFAGIGALLVRVARDRDERPLRVGAGFLLLGPPIMLTVVVLEDGWDHVAEHGTWRDAVYAASVFALGAGIMLATRR